MVATSNIHLRQKEPNDTKQGEGRNAYDEQHRNANQHLGQRHLDDDERPFAEEISARHAAASRIFIAVIIVAVVTMIIITPGMPAPYTKLWR